MSEIKYRPEIDGLRAIAVLAVVVFHVGLGLKGGYVGVDIFFVISGFLITGIIQKNLNKDCFSLANFWERRIRRIFPALAATVLATLFIGYVLLLPQDLEELGKSSFAQALLVANLYFWSDTGYFAGPAELKPLLHTWSLAVEEQFYLLYPFFLVLLKKQSVFKRFFTVAGATACSFGLCIYGSYYYPSSTFFLLPTRAWELFAGALIALSPWGFSRSRYLNEFVCLVGFLMVIAAIVFLDEGTTFPYLLPVVGTVAIIYGTSETRETLIGRLLSIRPIVFVGLMSYSIYLWHWPAIVFARIRFGHLGWKQITFALVVTSVSSFISWWLVEGLTRKKTVLGTRKSLFLATIFGWCLMIGASLSFAVSGGLPSRFPSNLSTIIEDTEWTGVQEIPYGPTFSSANFEVIGVPSESSMHDHLNRPDLFVWGDSHAAVLIDALNDRAKKLSLSGAACVSDGQIPIPGVAKKKEKLNTQDQLKAREKIMSYLESNRPKNLLLIARWSWYVEGYLDIELESNSRFSASDHFLTSAADGTAESRESNMRLVEVNFYRLVYFCEKHAIKIWILKQVPETGETSPAGNLLLRTTGRKSWLPNARRDQEQHAKRQSRVNSILDSSSSEYVRFIDPAITLFDRDGQTINYKNDRALYRDEDHLTKWGVEQIGPILDSVFTEMLGNEPAKKK